MNTLLPIRAVSIRLKLLSALRPEFFHHAQLASILDEIIKKANLPKQRKGIWFEAQESGRTTYQRNNEYFFNLFCIATSYPLFIEVLDSIRRLPDNSWPQENQNDVFNGKFRFNGLNDYFTQKPIKHQNELSTYDEQALETELVFWKQQESLVLRFLSPAQLKNKQKKRGKRKFIGDRGDFKTGDIENRIVDSLSRISPKLKIQFAGLDASYQEVSDRLFWTDNKQTLINGKMNSFGGALGEISLSDPSKELHHLPLIVLGQYIGIGEKRNQGLGRYRLETEKGLFKTPTIKRALSHQQRSAKIGTLELACYNIARKHPYIRKYIDRTFLENDPEIEEQLEDKKMLEHVNLHALSYEIENESYEASILQGVILNKAGKNPRPLAVPPLEDRIAQRAVVEIMGVDIDKLSTIDSYGYRKGKSRMNARDKIMLLNRQGYEWFFDADIEDFFDLVKHAEIELRLKSFFPDEPLVSLIMDWIRAPVKFDGEIISRPTGLPQGSSVSPMLANLLLEDLDSDLESQGMKLIRFADDFVIVCKSEKQAKQAAQRADQSLQELGLEFNPKKTDIGHFRDGFSFLGYHFIDGLVVETQKNKRKKGKLTLENIPPSSWLATILHQRPQLLDKLNKNLEKKYQKNDLSRITSTPKQKSPELPFNELGSTLFITPPGKYLHQKNGRLEIIDSESKQVLSQQNWNDLNKIIIIGRHNLSQQAQISAMKQGINIHYCSAGGKYLGVTSNSQASQEGPQLWLQQQNIFTNQNKLILPLIKQLIEAKIHNQIEVIRQRIRHSEDKENNPITAMQSLVIDLKQAQNTSQIRGYEGQASALYFSQLKKWIPEEFEFSTRQKRPSTDPFNALLSLGYTIIYSHTASILHIAGLYPWQGFFHQGYGRHMALASDLMETYRHIVDRTAMTVLRSGQLKTEDFYILPDGSCRLTQDAIRIYLKQLSARILKPMVSKQFNNNSEALNMHEHLLQTSNQIIRLIRNNQEQVVFFKLR